MARTAGRGAVELYSNEAHDCFGSCRASLWAATMRPAGFESSCPKRPLWRSLNWTISTT